MKPKTPPKYRNYAALSAAFKSGELSQHHYIMLDKGGMDASLSYRDPAAPAEENDKRNDECRALFDPEYADHIFDLYAALGIRAEWC